MSPTWPLETLATTTFEERGGKTTVTVKWADHNGTEEKRKTFGGAHDGKRMGWTGAFEQLDEYLAKSR